MPFDSMPRSLRGWRLATITTFLPTNASGEYVSAIPATIWRTSVPRSTSSRSSLEAPLTRSAALTSPTRMSTLRKSSIEIRPSATGCSEGGAGAGRVGRPLAEDCSCKRRRFCTVSSFTRRGNTASTRPIFPPMGSDAPFSASNESDESSELSPSCRQMLVVASGMTGASSPVATRRASAAVYRMVANRDRSSSFSRSASAHGSVSTRYLLTAPISSQTASKPVENSNRSKQAV